MRKRITKSAPTSGRGARKVSNRPEGESRFSKPSIKKSSFRSTGNGAPAGGDSTRPRFEKPNFDKPRFGERDSSSRDSFRSEKPRFDKPRYDGPRASGRDNETRDFKPRGEFSPREGSDRPRFDKPKFDRPRNSGRDNDSRDFKPRGEFSPREGSDRPRFDKPRYDGPRASGRDNDSRDFKPRGEFSPREGSDRPRFDKPRYDGPRATGRDNDSRDFKPRGEFSPREGSDRPRPSRGGDFSSQEGRSFTERRNSGKPSLKKKDFEGSEEVAKPSDEGLNRRVGRFETAPRYNLVGYEKKSNVKLKDDNAEIRLNRYISNAGICSRREADELISSGQITVNGKVVTEMGHKVLPSDTVKFGKKVLNPEKQVYILINKPKDYITTTEDPEERKTVLDLIQGACQERVYPVGRLDRNTTGLLLLTNDGELAVKLTHPSGGVKKIYQAELDRPITTEDFEKLKQGLVLEDGAIKPDEVGLVTPDAMVVGLEIHSGRNRIVRRMFEHLGYEVQKLDRTVFAGLNKKELPRGKWRFLTEKEVVRLKFMKTNA
jgi:23S rRNA pseudouridine2605 synthase